MALAFVATVWDAFSNRETLFAEPMTSESRGKVLRLVIFALLPLSIIFHELGHAAAIWTLGREVLDFGFFFVYGFVSFDPRGLSDTQQGLIALAGPLVSVIIGLAALALGWFKPMRTSFASLLLLFGILELGNALVFYPVMDAIGAVGEGGDWHVIYSTATPEIGIPVAIFHVAVLIGAILVWRSDSIRQGYARRTGRMRRTPEQIGRRSDLARIMSNAAGAASSQWKHPIELVADAQQGGIQMILRWQSEGFKRALLVHSPPLDGPDPHIEIHAAIRALDPGLPPYERPLNRVDGEPNVDELAAYIRRALDTVDSWDGAVTVN